MSEPAPPPLYDFNDVYGQAWRLIEAYGDIGFYTITNTGGTCYCACAWEYIEEMGQWALPVVMDPGHMRFTKPERDRARKYFHTLIKGYYDGD